MTEVRRRQTGRVTDNRSHRELCVRKAEGGLIKQRVVPAIKVFVGKLSRRLRS